MNLIFALFTFLFKTVQCNYVEDKYDLQPVHHFRLFPIFKGIYKSVLLMFYFSFPPSQKFDNFLYFGSFPTTNPMNTWL